MKLTKDEAKQLIGAAGMAHLNSIERIIGDACELLTAKIVILMRAKAKKLIGELIVIPPDTPERAVKAAEINALNFFAVELSKME